MHDEKLFSTLTFVPRGRGFSRSVTFVPLCPSFYRLTPEIRK
jgi:hypothetical protein